MPPLSVFYLRTVEEYRFQNYNTARYFLEIVTSVCNVLDAVYVCSYCCARLFSAEKQGINGLASAGDTTVLRDLFTRNNDVGKDFHNNIRSYNSAFTFTSMGVKLDKDLVNSKEFDQKIHSVIYTPLAKVFVE
ncbi:hypothetical protein Glove_19g5 [Diversispora epigaea]|uniref:Uncharacterized protein n=1 Tax=Diversispora epigaea TaxID=1348612 RepID=A0A397JKQ3_9GLOM|nr:hypothetical protein Glove_19g5 [Diversispora epigaea]